MIKQGDIYLANLNPTKGSEQSGFRPVLVLQKDILNSKLKTVIIAPITSNLEAKNKLITFFLDKTSSKLKKDSVVLLFQARTIDKIRLEKKISTLPNYFVDEVKKQFWKAF